MILLQSARKKTFKSIFAFIRVKLETLALMPMSHISFFFLKFSNIFFSLIIPLNNLFLVSTLKFSSYNANKLSRMQNKYVTSK